MAPCGGHEARWMTASDHDACMRFRKDIIDPNVAKHLRCNAAATFVGKSHYGPGEPEAVLYPCAENHSMNNHASRGHGARRKQV